MIDALAAFPATLKDALAAAGPRLRIRARDGRFAMVEHLCHLGDLEREGYGARIERLLSEDAPEWDDFDGETVARERNYLALDAERRCSGSSTRVRRTSPVSAPPARTTGSAAARIAAWGRSRWRSSSS